MDSRRVVKKLSRYVMDTGRFVVADIDLIDVNVFIADIGYISGNREEVEKALSGLGNVVKLGGDRYASYWLVGVNRFDDGGLSNIRNVAAYIISSVEPRHIYDVRNKVWVIDKYVKALAMCSGFDHVDVVKDLEGDEVDA